MIWFNVSLSVGVVVTTSALLWWVRKRQRNNGDKSKLKSEESLNLEGEPEQECIELLEQGGDVTESVDDVTEKYDYDVTEEYDDDVSQQHMNIEGML